jgi:hypothetical protein
MQPRLRIALAVFAAVALCAGTLRAEETGLKKGMPDLKSAGPMAFGPEGILFVGDPQGAAIFAIDTGDKTPAKADSSLKIESLDGKIASVLGIDIKQLRVNDLQVNPLSGKVYLSLMRGQGKEAVPVILRINGKGELEEVSLKDVAFAKATLPNASDKQRQESITHVEFVKGVVYVSGLSNEDFSSNLRGIPFPFKEANNGTGVEIFHGAHGQFETRSPVRTFTAYDIKGETNLLAAYQCTPLVKIPVSQLKPGEKIKGTTVAELGSGNRPLSMFVYEKGGKDYILVANNNRGVMKIPTEGIDSIVGITKPVGINKTAGLNYETIKELKKVEKLARLDRDHAVILAKADTPEGSLYLKAIALP